MDRIATQQHHAADHTKRLNRHVLSYTAARHAQRAGEKGLRPGRAQEDRLVVSDLVSRIPSPKAEDAKQCASAGRELRAAELWRKLAAQSGCWDLAAGLARRLQLGCILFRRASCPGCGCGARRCIPGSPQFLGFQRPAPVVSAPAHPAGCSGSRPIGPDNVCVLTHRCGRRRPAPHRHPCPSTIGRDEAEWDNPEERGQSTSLGRNLIPGRSPADLTRGIGNQSGRHEHSSLVQTLRWTAW